MSSHSAKEVDFKEPHIDLRPRASPRPFVRGHSPLRQDKKNKLSSDTSATHQTHVRMNLAKTDKQPSMSLLSGSDALNSNERTVSPLLDMCKMSDSIKSIYTMLASDSETEISLTTESSESKNGFIDDQFNLEKVGAGTFASAHLNANRREAITHALRCSLDQTKEDLRYLQLKLDSRIQEVDLIINREEKIMTQFKSAFTKATKNEINQMIAAGWTRAGNLGKVNLENFLRPFNINIDKYPTAFLGKTLTGQTDTKHTTIPLMNPPQLTSIAAYDCCPWSLTSSAHVKENIQQKICLEKTRRSFVEPPALQLDRDNINAFVRIMKIGNEVNEEILEDDVSTGTESDGTISSISTIDKNEISRVLKRLDDSSTCCVESFFCRLFGKKNSTQSYQEYKTMIQNQLENYFKDVKRYKKQAKNSLPGKLSSVCLNPPPSPKYPKGGLVLSSSSSSSSSSETLSSEAILSDILTEFDESEPDEASFAILFEEKDRNLFSTHHPMKKDYVKNCPEVFTTTFQIGIQTRFPDVVCALKRAAKVERNLRIDEEPLENKKNTILDQCCINVYTESVTTQPTISDSNLPMEITEYWQLASIEEEPVWIYRGRSVIQT